MVLPPREAGPVLWPRRQSNGPMSPVAPSPTEPECTPAQGQLGPWVWPPGLSWMLGSRSAVARAPRAQPPGPTTVAVLAQAGLGEQTEPGCWQLLNSVGNRKLFGSYIWSLWLHRAPSSRQPPTGPDGWVGRRVRNPLRGAASSPRVNSRGDAATRR